MEENLEKNNTDIFYFIYFIESHPSSLNMKISLSEKYSESNTLELLQEIKQENSQSSFSVNIYKFKFFPNKVLEQCSSPEKFEIEIISENDSNNKVLTQINNLDMNHNNFLYNLSIDYEIFFSEEMNSPGRLNMNYLEQFQLYLNYIKKII